MASIVSVTAKVGTRMARRQNPKTTMVAALLTAARSRNAVRRPRATASDARAIALLTLNESAVGTSRREISRWYAGGIAGEIVTSNAAVPMSRRPPARYATQPITPTATISADAVHAGAGRFE